MCCQVLKFLCTVISMCYVAEQHFLFALTMSIFVPTKHHLREALLFCFKLKKSACDRHRLVCEAYKEHDASIKIWFRRFKSSDFDTIEKERDRRSEKFENA